MHSFQYVSVTSLKEAIAQMSDDGAMLKAGGVDLLDMMKEWFAGTAKEAKEKKGLDMQYAESFRRIKLYVPKEEKKEAD